MNFDSIAEIYVAIDDFCILYEVQIKQFRLESSLKPSRNRKSRLSDAEIMTILVCFHRSHYTNFKAFYLEMVCTYWNHIFPNLVVMNLGIQSNTNLFNPWIRSFKIVN